MPSKEILEDFNSLGRKKPAYQKQDIRSKDEQLYNNKEEGLTWVRENQ